MFSVKFAEFILPSFKSVWGDWEFELINYPFNQTLNLKIVGDKFTRISTPVHLSNDEELAKQELYSLISSLTTEYQS